MKKFGTVFAVAAVLALGACDTMNSPSNTSNSGGNYPQSSGSSGAYNSYGVVQSIDLVRAENGIGGSGIGIGTIAGAVIGGVVGNQVGSGRGNTAATVVGAAGGAYAGHEIEKRSQQQADAYKFTVRMNNGNLQTVTQSSSADIQVGDRVQIDNGVLRRY
jgi:outer membrane lipoprotein SlyB